MPRQRSFSALTVLHAVATGSAYGFEVIDATGLPSGTVYPALGRLERDGYVQSSWEQIRVARQEKRPPRKYYRMTAPGVRVLEQALARFRARKRFQPATHAKAAVIGGRNRVGEPRRVVAGPHRFLPCAERPA